MGSTLFYKNWAISRELIGRELWSIKRADDGKDAIVAQFVSPFLAQAIFQEITARVVSLQSIEHFDVISMIHKKNCCRFVK